MAFEFDVSLSAHTFRMPTKTLTQHAFFQRSSEMFEPATTPDDEREREMYASSTSPHGTRAASFGDALMPLTTTTTATTTTTTMISGRRRHRRNSATAYVATSSDVDRQRHVSLIERREHVAHVQQHQQHRQHRQQQQQQPSHQQRNQPNSNCKQPHQQLQRRHSKLRLRHTQSMESSDAESHGFASESFARSTPRAELMMPRVSHYYAAPSSPTAIDDVSLSIDIECDDDDASAPGSLLDDNDSTYDVFARTSARNVKLRATSLDRDSRSTSSSADHFAR
jgi:hypothetical protein